MRFVFIQTKIFADDMNRLRLSLEDLRQIEIEITFHPDRYPVIPGTNGLRKMRFAPERSSGGKSGGIRLCYFVMDEAGHVYLVTAFGKNEKSNLTAEEHQLFGKMVAAIKMRYRN